MLKIFADFDWDEFWSDEDYSREEYIEKPLTKQAIASVEKELGYKLPVSYIELLSTQNGGLVSKTCFPTKTPTSWADDHIAIQGISGIGGTKDHSLCGSLGSKFMIEEWGYPNIGVCICDTPSAGHDLVMLDYSECGPQGEPRLIHVDQELDYAVTILAPNFESFVRGLVSEDAYDTSDAELNDALNCIKSGCFSKLLSRFFSGPLGVEHEMPFRSLLTSLTQTKGYFALHADSESQTAYDLQFFAHHTVCGPVDEPSYLKAYPEMIAFGDGEITTKGYGPSFVEEWLCNRIKAGLISKDAMSVLHLTGKFKDSLFAALKNYS